MKEKKTRRRPIKRWLKRFDHRKIEIVENYMRKEQEFTVYFYKV